jgi:hypothetical protein
MGKQYQSYRKDVDKDEKPLTNNSQKVYLDPPTQGGDDETTIIFTQNMNRIIENPNGEEAIEKYENDEPTHNVRKVIQRLVTTMSTVPENHYVWNYLDPTRTHYINNDQDEDQLNTEENRTLNNFIDWYDLLLMTIHELKRTTWEYDPLTIENQENHHEWRISTVGCMGRK